MDKRALQNYAIWAKNNLEQQIALSLKSLGINSATDIKQARIVGERTIIDGDFNSYPKDLKIQRDSLINLIKSDGYDQVIEESAYTWFNRIIALRFMEIHDFLPHGFKILSSRDGGIEPEILKHLGLVKDELKLDMDYLVPLQQQGNIEEVFRYVLFHQCNALSKILPMLFTSEQDYLELLLPKTLLRGETVVSKLLEIGEEPFKNDVEVIGWLYQFYISQEKDAVFASKKTITKDTLPAVTQLFTPDWIVRYMAENSVGRIWLESYPDSPLRGTMKYYVDDAKQEADVQKKIDEIKYKNVKPEEIKVMEPCCGSGHILVYVFDLLFKMYEEKGYLPREIPTLILKNNLFGLEIDKRASQLASFALVMKARSYNSRFFNKDYYVAPNVYEILDSHILIDSDYRSRILESRLLTTGELNDIEWIVEKFRYAKTIGSLLKFEKTNFDGIKASIKKLHDGMVLNILNSYFLNDGLEVLSKLVDLAEIMTKKYDVMITNPPYIGISTMEKEVKDYASKYYPDSKTDMCAMFMETGFVKKNGFLAMINMHSWMFLSSYERLRKNIIRNEYIVNMLHLGAHAFEMIGGEVVQTTTFVIRNTPIATNGVYFRLVDEKDKESAFLAGGGKIMFNICSLKTIPGSPFAYWISGRLLKVFQEPKLAEFAEANVGMISGDNDRFLRLWYEVDITKSYLNASDYIEAFASGKKWFPLQKGGNRRFWYGNLEYLINYQNDGLELKFENTINGRVRSHNYNGNKAFQPGITWNSIGTADLITRISEKGFLFDAAGPLCTINNEEDTFYFLALLFSKVAQTIFRFINPTINYTPGTLLSLPICFCNEKKGEINCLVDGCINKSKNDWNAFETSWDFKKHPLI